MKKIYLHIGYHKTGTTAIQALLTYNETFLNKKKALYPVNCRIANNVKSGGPQIYAHHLLPKYILSDAQNELEDLIAEINKSKAETIILSSEVFCQEFRTNEDNFVKLKSLFRDFELKIIIYLRPQEDLFESVYNQLIKDSKSFERLDSSVLANGQLGTYYDFFHLVRLWEKYFGADSIIVRPYERKQFYGEDLLKDFWYQIFFEELPKNMVIPERATNPRLELDALEFMRMINTVDCDHEVKRHISDILLSYSENKNPNTTKAFHNHGLLTCKERAMINKAFSDSNSKLAKKYLNRKDGRLFYSADKDCEDVIKREINNQEAIVVGKYLLANFDPQASNYDIEDQLNRMIAKGVVEQSKNKFYDDGVITEEGIFFKNYGHCPSCNRDVEFIAKSRHLGISYICTNCDSRPRERALMNAIENFYPNWRNLIIHESSPLLRRGTSKRLKAECKNYYPSQYYPDISPGVVHKGFQCENLESLTFEDNSIDIHVTQDVMEHVSRPSKAFSEIARTLKPGGAHIFTIPIVQKNNPSKMRAIPNEEGGFDFLDEPQYHGSPVGDGQGALVTVDWGYDICELIYNVSGLITHIFKVDDLSKGIRSPRTDVFVSVKPNREANKIL